VPDYARCVEGALLNSDETGPDISRADFVFCVTALTWGWSVEDVAERLMEETARPRRTERPMPSTARNAALAIEPRQRPTLG
jgi:hypothetical protein